MVSPVESDGEVSDGSSADPPAEQLEQSSLDRSPVVVMQLRQRSQNKEV